MTSSLVNVRSPTQYDESSQLERETYIYGWSDNNQ